MQVSPMHWYPTRASPSCCGWGANSRRRTDCVVLAERKLSGHNGGLGTEPAIRASAVRDTLAFLDTFEPGSRQRVLDAVPAASREVIEQTPGSSWISIEHDHWTIDAMIDI